MSNQEMLCMVEPKRLNWNSWNGKQHRKRKASSEEMIVEEM